MKSCMLQRGYVENILSKFKAFKRKLHLAPDQVTQSDHWSDLDNRCALQLYEREGVRAI